MNGCYCTFINSGSGSMTVPHSFIGPWTSHPLIIAYVWYNKESLLVTKTLIYYLVDILLCCTGCVNESVHTTHMKWTAGWILTYELSHERVGHFKCLWEATCISIKRFWDIRPQSWVLFWDAVSRLWWFLELQIYVLIWNKHSGNS